MGQRVYTCKEFQDKQAVKYKIVNARRGSIYHTFGLVAVDQHVDYGDIKEEVWTTFSVWTRFSVPSLRAQKIFF